MYPEVRATNGLSGIPEGGIDAFNPPGEAGAVRSRFVGNRGVIFPVISVRVLALIFVAADDPNSGCM
jgi:hypothetical protein